MSGQDEFFDELGKRTVGDADRLTSELRAHLEDAGETGLKSLGNPSDIASLFNRVRFEREGPVWILSTILLGAFALVVQLLTVWIISGFLSQVVRRVTDLPMSFALNPGSLVQLVIYALAFPWVYAAFWICVKKAFRVTGKTRWTAALAAWLVLFPVGANLLSRLYDPRASSEFPIDIVVASLVILFALVSAAWITKRQATPVPALRRMSAPLWIALLAIIVLTSIGFGMRDADGALAAGIGFPTPLLALIYARDLFETAAGSMLSVFLGFLSPAAMWSLIGVSLTAWWTYGIISAANHIRQKKGVPWAGIVTVVYLTSILSMGAQDVPDVPDVSFRVPVTLVSLRVEQSEIWMWTGLHRYFNRTNNVFPFYHAAWDGARKEFLVEQSAIYGGSDTLVPVGQWYVRPAERAEDATITDTGDLSVQPGGYGIRGPDGRSITPPEPDDDDVTLDELVESGIRCDTDEPFPSCFKFYYGGRELFSQATRSATVSQAIVSDDKHWMLLTLTTRHGGNEHVYLFDLR